MTFIQILILCLGLFPHKKRLTEFRMAGVAQGTTYGILYYARDSMAQNKVDALLNKIDSSLSIYKPYSLISRFNQENRGVISDDFLKLVVNRSKQVYEDSQGSFDITVLPLMQFWGFGKRQRTTMPAKDSVTAIIQCVGSDKIFISGDSLIKTNPCVQIDVNGIAQGYSVDLIASMFEKEGIRNYLVELGGEIRVKGKKPNGDFFKIEVESAGDNNVIRLRKGAITTSGSYRQFVEINNRRLPHLIDPRTGYPLEGKTSAQPYGPKTA